MTFKERKHVSEIYIFYKNNLKLHFTFGRKILTSISITHAQSIQITFDLAELVSHELFASIKKEVEFNFYFFKRPFALELDYSIVRLRRKTAPDKGRTSGRPQVVAQERKFYHGKEMRNLFPTYLFPVIICTAAA